MKLENRSYMTVEGPGVFQTDTCSRPGCIEYRGNGTHAMQVPACSDSPLLKRFGAAYFLMLSLFEGLPGVVRVSDPSKADAFFPPFLSSVLYDKGHERTQVPFVQSRADLEGRFVAWLTNQTYWKRSGGRDHVIVVHHPSALKRHLRKLKTGIFVRGYFARPSSKTSSASKDVIAPFHAMVRPYLDDFQAFDSVEQRDTGPLGYATCWDGRPNLLFVMTSARVKRADSLQQRLVAVLSVEEDALVKAEDLRQEKMALVEAHLRWSKFCLMLPSGDTPFYTRFSDAILSHCLPVIVSERIELPYADVIDYKLFSVFMPMSKALQPGALVALLRGIQLTEYNRMHDELMKVRPMFTFSQPALPGHAEHSLWAAIQRKLRRKRGKIMAPPFRDKHSTSQGTLQ
eukprot:TRINITY_DN6730_c0_g1_i1.p1 TRINITY_DN6730_c0_g1~~TRINITY_DN6730_c0_g1_i1.p1  ORF type:complete len:411 (+),score=33.72 TRINITY_DN6730_c0_g1_i1:35-1234(+)